MFEKQSYIYGRDVNAKTMKNVVNLLPKTVMIF